MTARWWHEEGPGLADPPPLAGGDDDYDDVFARLSDQLHAAGSDIADEQADVPRLLAELDQHPEDRQRLLLENSRRFQTWAVAAALIDRCSAQRPHDPAAAVSTGKLAVAAVENLDVAAYGKARVRDLEGRAWAHLASALRVRDEFLAAEEAFALARRKLAEGTGDAVERANLLWLHAALRIDQRRFDRAFALLDRVIAIARRFADLHLWGKALLSKSFCYSSAGEPEAAIRLLEEASRLIDPGREPRLLLVARHNLIDALIDADRSDLAAEMLDRVRELHRRLGNRVDGLRLRWLEAKIAAAAGRADEAEAIFLEVRDGLVAAELGYDAALVSLDLAVLYCRQGRASDMYRLADEMLVIFHGRSIRRETIAALMLFRDAVDLEQVSYSLMHELSELFDRARRQPDLRFDPASDER